MNRKLKKYLQKCSRATVDETMLDDLRREMEQAIPEITKSIRQREALAAELRIARSKTSESDSERRN